MDGQIQGRVLEEPNNLVDSGSTLFEQDNDSTRMHGAPMGAVASAIHQRLQRFWEVAEAGLGGRHVGRDHTHTQSGLSETYSANETMQRELKERHTRETEKALNLKEDHRS